MIPDCLTLNIGGRQFEDLSKGRLKAVRLKESEWLTKRLETRYRFIRIANGLRFISSAFVAQFDRWTLDGKKYTLHIGDILAHKPLGFDAYDPGLFTSLAAEDVDTDWGVPDSITFVVVEAAFKVMVTGEKKEEFRQCTKTFKNQMASKARFIKVANGYHPNNEAFIAEYLGAEEQDNVNVTYSNGLAVEMDKAIVFKIGKIIAYRFVPGKEHTHYTNEMFGAPLVKVNTGTRKPASDACMARRKAALFKAAEAVFSPQRNMTNWMLYENIELLKAACAVRHTINIPLDMRLMAKKVLAIGGMDGARLVLAYAAAPVEEPAYAEAEEPVDAPVDEPTEAEADEPVEAEAEADEPVEAEAEDDERGSETQREGQSKAKDKGEDKGEDKSQAKSPATILAEARRKKEEKKRQLRELFQKLHELKREKAKRKADDISEDDEENATKALPVPPTRNWVSKQEDGTLDEEKAALEKKRAEFAESKEKRGQKQKDKTIVVPTDVRKAKRAAEIPLLQGAAKKRHEDAKRRVAAMKAKKERRQKIVEQRAYESKKKRKLIVEPEAQGEAQDDGGSGFGAIGGQSISGGSFGLDGRLRRLKRVVALMAVVGVCIIAGFSIGLALRWS